MNEWPRNDKSHSFPGTKVPGNERSRARMVHGPFVPENESSTMGTYEVLGTNNLENECSIILQDHYDDERNKIMFQHDTRTARQRPIFLSETGLVLRPTVSDHITGIEHVFSMFDEYNVELFRKIQSSVHC